MKRLLLLFSVVFSVTGHAGHVHIKVSPELLESAKGDFSKIYGYHVNASASKEEKTTTITIEFRESGKKGPDDELPILSFDTFGELSLKREGLIVAELDISGEIDEGIRRFKFTVANDLLKESMFTLRSYPKTRKTVIKWLKGRQRELEGKQGALFEPTLHGVNCEIPLHLVLNKDLWNSSENGKLDKQNKSTEQAR